jgi:hypothetical protein
VATFLREAVVTDPGLRDEARDRKLAEATALARQAAEWQERHPDRVKVPD